MTSSPTRKAPRRGRTLAGGGKGGGSSRGATEAPDTLRSREMCMMGLAVSEGPIVGPINAMKSIKLDNTAVQAADGSYNFSNWEAYFERGTVDQAYVQGLNAAESVISEGVDVVFATPLTRFIADTTYDRVRITLRWAGFYKQNTQNGNLEETTCAVRIQVENNGGGFVTVVNETVQGKQRSTYERTYTLLLPSPGPWSFRVSRQEADPGAFNHNEFQLASWTLLIDGKFAYPNTALLVGRFDAEQFPRLPVLSGDYWGLYMLVPKNYDPYTRFRATTGDGTTGGAWNGEFKLAPYCNNPAWAWYLLATSKRFGAGNLFAAEKIDTYALESIARENDRLIPKGTKRAAVASAGAFAVVNKAGGNKYTRAAGSFVTDGWAVGDCVQPAGFTNGENNRPGFVTAVSATELSILWDQEAGLTGWNPVVCWFVTEAAGSRELTAIDPVEPQWVCNMYLQKAADVYKVLMEQAGIFNGLVYYGGGAIVPTQDRPGESVTLFTQANVEEGKFSYSTSAESQKISDVLVSFTDLSNNGKLAYDLVSDEGLRDQVGFRKRDQTCLGCTSRTEAKRRGKMWIETEKRNGRAVVFTAGLEAGMLRPKDVFDVMDHMLVDGATGARGGLLYAVTDASHVETDKPVILAPGVAYTLAIATSTHTVQRRAIITPAGTVTNLEVSPAFGEVPQVNGVWVLESDTLAARQFRVVTIKPMAPPKFQVTALRYDADKYGAVDFGIDPPDTPTSDIPLVFSVSPPSSINAQLVTLTEAMRYRLIVDLSWVRSPDRFIRGYVVSWRPAGGNWVDLPMADQAGVQIPVDSARTYDFKVRAVNFFGIRSAAAELLGYDTPAEGTDFQVLSLRCKEGGTDFSTPDCEVLWDFYNGGFGDSDQHPLFSHFHLEIHAITMTSPGSATGEALIHEVDITDPRYNYSAQRNLIDGGMRRVLRFVVTPYDTLGNAGVSDTITATNAAISGFDDTDINAYFDGNVITLAFPDTSLIKDFKEWRVWRFPSGGLVPGAPVDRVYGTAPFGQTAGSTLTLRHDLGDAWDYYILCADTITPALDPGNVFIKTVTNSSAPQGPVVQPPTVTPESQTFASSVTVFATADAGCTVRYTYDGSPVTASSEVFPGGGGMYPDTITLRFAAFDAVGRKSDEILRIYIAGSAPGTLRCASPRISFSQRPGRAGNATLTCAQAGVTLYYDKNGSGLTAYTVPVALAIDDELAAQAKASGYNDSAFVYFSNASDGTGGGGGNLPQP